MTTSIVRVHGTNFITGAAGVEMGCGGPDLKSAYLRVAGPDDYFWGVKNDGSTGGGVDCGIDPGTYVAELAGYNSVQMTYPAGLVTAGARAAIIAAAMLLQPWCTSATVALSDNADGSRSIEVVGDYDEIAPGSRTWSSRGAAGQWGSHLFRAAPEVGGALNIAITRNIASAISTPPANAQFWGIGMQLGPNVSVLAANRPRIYLRAGGTPTDPAGSVLLFDCGQIPASAIVANSLAMISFTPAQAAALRTALNGIGASQLWACTENIAITEYVGLPTGGGWNGQLADDSVRVDTVTSSDPTTPAPVAWDSTGMLSFGFLIPIRLFYEVDPAGNAESYPVQGSLRVLSGFPNDVLLPDTETLMAALPGSGYRDNYKFYQTEIFITDGAPGIRQCYDEGGDPAAFDMTGATTILDIGETTTSGVITTLQPTGDAAISVPNVMSYRFKGTGSTGRGALDPLNNTPIQPNDFIRVSDGGSPWEFDYAGPGGDPTVPFMDPVVGLATFPDNLPALRITYIHPADSVTLVPPPPPPPPPPPVPPTPGPVSIGGGGGGGGGGGARGSQALLSPNAYVLVEGPVGWIINGAADPIPVRILGEEEGGPTGLTVSVEPISNEQAQIMLEQWRLTNAEHADADASDVLPNPQPANNALASRRVFASGSAPRVFSKHLVLPRRRR